MPQLVERCAVRDAEQRGGDRLEANPAAWDLVLGGAVTLAALPVAWLIHAISERFPGRPESAVLTLGGLFAVLILCPAAAYLLRQREAAEPGRVGLIVLAGSGVLLVSVYLYWVSFLVMFPADILVWAESDFVNDIVKLRQGYPIYSAQENNESFTYVPGAQIVTYGLAWLLGRPTSIPLYRMIQLGYTLLASIVAVCCCRRLMEMSLGDRRAVGRGVWGIIWFPLLFLVAGNSLTNPFAHNLHNDALAQLVAVSAYWLLLKYAATRDTRVLAAMAIAPAAAFFVKQSLVIWAAFYAAHLLLFDRPRSVKRVMFFVLAAGSGIVAMVAGCYLVWGDHFIYWTFTVLGSHGVSPLRSFQHVLDAWTYFAVGLLGGLVLLRGTAFNHLLGPWLIWLCLFLLQAYTSGIAWMRNHMGPGSLIAAIWFLAALARVWPYLPATTATGRRTRMWLRGATAVAIVGLMFSGLGIVRIPVRPISSDAYRYVGEIEKEFEGHAADTVLLDAGTWIYLKQGVVMKDRAPSIGERGYSETGDFSAMIQRIRDRRYAKILVRNFDSTDFWYEHYSWRKPSGIRGALREGYHEVARIPGVEGNRPEISPYQFGPVSVLTPKRPNGS